MRVSVKGKGKGRTDDKHVLDEIWPGGSSEILKGKKLLNAMDPKQKANSGIFVVVFEVKFGNRKLNYLSEGWNFVEQKTGGWFGGSGTLTGSKSKYYGIGMVLSPEGEGNARLGYNDMMDWSQGNEYADRSEKDTVGQSAYIPAYNGYASPQQSYNDNSSYLVPLALMICVMGFCLICLVINGLVGAGCYLFGRFSVKNAGNDKKTEAFQDDV